jgi:hypothetical protein
MASGPQDREHRFIEVGWGFPGVLLGSRALRWRVSGSVLGATMPDDALLAAKPSHMGVNVDRASLLPTPSYRLWMTDKGQSPLTNAALLCLTTKLLLRVLLPMLAHTLLLSGNGTESPDRRCLV